MIVKGQKVSSRYEIIKTIDENAFIIVGEAGEITGLGFKELDTELERSNFFKKISSKKSWFNGKEQHLIVIVKCCS